jgi:hypothetical protein
MAFSPAEIEAKAGDTIEWINNDVFAHTATVQGGFEVMLPPKKSGSAVVEMAGTVDYLLPLPSQYERAHQDSAVTVRCRCLAPRWALSPSCGRRR